MTDQVIINAAERFGKKAPPPQAEDSRWTPERVRSSNATMVKILPFTSWGSEYWPDKMWADVPTNDYRTDRERGKRFAKMTLMAMTADRAIARPLEKIFEDIVEDAIRRRAKGGKGSRTLPGAVSGYLEGLAEFIASECGPPAA